MVRIDASSPSERRGCLGSPLQRGGMLALEPDYCRPQAVLDTGGSSNADAGMAAARARAVCGVAPLSSAARTPTVMRIAAAAVAAVANIRANLGVMCIAPSLVA